jgi:hypothetical protein
VAMSSYGCAVSGVMFSTFPVSAAVNYECDMPGRGITLEYS